MKAIDLFAGAGGWSQACRDLGVEELGVDCFSAACATRFAAGHATIEASVLDLDPLDFADFDTLIASPPCQTFSVSGGGAGRAAMTEIVRAIKDGFIPGSLDERTALSAEPSRWIRAVPFRSVFMEQVPPARPVFEAYGEWLRELGYSVEVDVLRSEDYGTPQTRKRVVLVARLDGSAVLPEPTYARPVSMGEALGIEEPFRVRSNYSGGKGPSGERIRGYRYSTEPSFTVTGRSATADKLEFESGSRNRTVSEAGVLQGFPEHYPWRGLKSEQALQVGNAIPVQLARAVINANINGGN